MSLTREMLNAMGLSDENINQIMAENGKSIQAEKNKTEKYRADAEKTATLEKQLEEINNQNLSDIEKANKQTELANNRIAELEKSIKLMEQRKMLSDIGIFGEEADKLVNNEGVIDYAFLGQIIKDRETKSASAKEKELLQGTLNPQGGQGESEIEPADVVNAKQLNFGNRADEQAIKDYYVIK